MKIEDLISGFRSQDLDPGIYRSKDEIWSSTCVTPPLWIGATPSLIDHIFDPEMVISNIWIEYLYRVESTTGFLGLRQIHTSDQTKTDHFFPLDWEDGLGRLNIYFIYRDKPQIMIQDYERMNQRWTFLFLISYHTPHSWDPRSRKWLKYIYLIYHEIPQHHESWGMINQRSIS